MKGKGKGKKNVVKKPKGKMNMKISSTGNVMKILNVRTAGSVNGMKDYPYLYRTELR